MQQQLKTFAECSCNAALASGYTGDFIGTAMETLWQRFCPNIEISCAQSNSLQEATSKLIYKYFRVHYPILIGLYSSEVTAAVQLQIRETVAEFLNVDVAMIDLNITLFAEDIQSASIEISVDVEDYATMEFFVESMDGSLAVQLGVDTGVSVSNEAARSEEIEEEVLYTDGRSAGNQIGLSMYIFVFGLAFLSSFF